MSDLIIWSPSMSVGVDILDDDHKRIMVLINKLHEAMLEGKGKKLLGEIFDGLIAYIKLHFDSEEALLEQNNYPDVSAQKSMHREMDQKVQSIAQQFRDDPDSVRPMEVLCFLRDWWVDHIMNSDQKYTAFLHEQGVR